MNLYLLRHGIAVDRDALDLASDPARPLTPKGRRQLRKVADALDILKIKFDAILSSPLVRAQQTAEVIVKGLKSKTRPSFTYELRPGGSRDKLIQHLINLKPAPENVLLVGHEPDMSELLSYLVMGQGGGGFSLKKGGLAKLEIEKLRAGKCATLAWLVTPGQMKLMS